MRKLFDFRVCFYGSLSFFPYTSKCLLLGAVPLFTIRRKGRWWPRVGPCIMGQLCAVVGWAELLSGQCTYESSLRIHTHVLLMLPFIWGKKTQKNEICLSNNYSEILPSWYYKRNACIIVSINRSNNSYLLWWKWRKIQFCFSSSSENMDANFLYITISTQSRIGTEVT